MRIRRAFCDTACSGGAGAYIKDTASARMRGRTVQMKTKQHELATRGVGLERVGAFFVSDGIAIPINQAAAAKE